MRSLYLLLALLALLPATPAQAAGAAESAPSFVPFEPVIVPVFNEGKVDGFLSVTFQIRTPNKDIASQVEDQRRRFVDAFTTALVVYAEENVDFRNPLNISDLAHTLANAAKNLSPADKKNTPLAIFIGDAMARKSR